MATTNPLAVLVAFDIELTFDKLARASELLHAGAALFATHVDVRCPTSFGYVPDCGSMTKMLEQTTGVRCSGDFGKPSLAMADYLRSRFCANGERAIMIGDRIYTDIPLGHRIGIDTALVLTGEASGDDVAGSDFQPTIIVDSFESLLRDSFPHAW
jgi:HAD superfamily hydrolase (TIGR01450 family)